MAREMIHWLWPKMIHWKRFHYKILIATLSLGGRCAIFQVLNKLSNESLSIIRLNQVIDQKNQFNLNLAHDMIWTTRQKNVFLALESQADVSGGQAWLLLVAGYKSRPGAHTLARDPVHCD